MVLRGWKLFRLPCICPQTNILHVCSIWLRSARQLSPNKNSRLDSKGKNAFSRIFGFPPKNFGGPYLGSPTWHKVRSVLKIIVWGSSLLTNIFLPLGKHNKASRASETSQIENFENFKIFPFWTQKPIFLVAKGSQWI